MNQTSTQAGSWLDRAIHVLDATAILIWGIVLTSLGILLFFDGLLPTKSEGPNPCWGEIFAGITIIGVGYAPFAVLRVRRRRKADEDHRGMTGNENIEPGGRG